MLDEFLGHGSRSFSYHEDQDELDRLCSLLEDWTGRNRQILTYRELTDEEVDRHLVDWSRFTDSGHLWRFPFTGFCEYRLTEEEISASLPTSELLLQTWGQWAEHRDIPNSNHTAETCDSTVLIGYLSKNLFKPLSNLETADKRIFFLFLLTPKVCKIEF